MTYALYIKDTNGKKELVFTRADNLSTAMEQVREALKDRIIELLYWYKR